MSKIHVYFMPGLAASSAIFEKIELPEAIFEMHLLEWILPVANESIQSYAKRMAQLVHHQEVVLIGVSFGGILVQEMAAFLQVKKVIIISSVKCNQEFPMHFKIAKTTKAYKLLPTSLLLNIENLAKFSFGDSAVVFLQLNASCCSFSSSRLNLDKGITWSMCQSFPRLFNV